MGAQDVLLEATTVHHRARDLIVDIVDMTPDDPRLDATVHALRKHVDRHMQEEEGRLFPGLRSAGLDLGALGARIATRKGELMAEMEQGGA